jgi:hypothetical protein
MSASQPPTGLVRRGRIGPIWCDGREILRRMFVTVRDRDWREVPVTSWHLTVDETSTIAEFEGRHTSDGVDFEWRGQLEISANSRHARFRFEGRALRDMDVCRLGLVILHPVESMVGAEVTACGPHGEAKLTVSRHIHPQPIVKGLPSAMTAPFSILKIARKDIGLLRLEFTGDLFELEDQRNWGDASFKTYCTPLSLGFPRRIARDSVVSQAVEVIYTPPSAAPTSRRRRSAVAASSSTEERAAARSSLPATPVAWRCKAPTIGCVVTDPVMDVLIGKNAIAAWDHLQLPWDAVTRERVGRLLAILPRSTQLELVVPSLENSGRLCETARVLRGHEDRIARILLTDTRQALPSARTVANLRLIFSDAGLGEVPVLLMPRGYFVELNRGECQDRNVDGFAFPLSSTVHASDTECVIDNVEAATDMVATLKSFKKGAQIAVAPLAAYYPARSEGHEGGDPLWTAWLAKIISRLSAAGVTSMTLAEDLAANQGR